MLVWSCIYVGDEGNSLSQFWGMSLGPWLRFLAFCVTLWCWWMFLCQVRNCVPYWSFLAKLICLPRSSSCFRISADAVWKAQPNSLLWSSHKEADFKYGFKLCIMLAPGFGGRQNTSGFEIHFGSLPWLCQFLRTYAQVLISPVSILCLLAGRFSKRCFSINAMYKNK